MSASNKSAVPWVRDLTLEAIESDMKDEFADPPSLDAMGTDLFGPRNRRAIAAWQHQQRARAMVAAVLAARLLHVRRGRLNALGLARDAEAITLEGLAALHRSHSGTFGQGFEIAVSDAINDGVIDVIKPVQNALRYLGLDEPIMGCAHLGLENLPAGARLHVLQVVLGALPSSVKFNTGQPGLRLPPEKALEPLLTATAGQGDGVTDSKLHKADALLWTERDVLAVSYKSNPKQIDWSGWRDVPVWIAGPFRPPATLPARVYPVAPAAVGGLWFHYLRRAHDLVDRVLADIDTGRPPLQSTGKDLPDWARSNTWQGSAFLELYAELRANRRETLAKLVDVVRAGAVPEVLAGVSAPGVRELHVDIGNDDQLAATLTGQVAATGLFTASRHLLVPYRGIHAGPVSGKLRNALAAPNPEPTILDDRSFRPRSRGKAT